MNKTILNLATVCFLLLAASCGNKGGNEVVAPQGMHTLNLNRFGKPFAIFVPDTITNKLNVTEQSNGSLHVKVGTNFAISINEQAADFEMKKMDIKDDEINKLKSFIADEPTAIMWESEIVEPEFHFLVNQKIDESNYSFEDIIDTEVKPFSKDAIQKMFESCKTIQIVKPETN